MTSSVVTNGLTKRFGQRTAVNAVDIDLPAGLTEQVKSVLPPGFEASSVDIIFRGKAPSKA